jgi:hypothetical protein
MYRFLKKSKKWKVYLRGVSFFEKIEKMEGIFEGDIVF